MSTLPSIWLSTSLVLKSARSWAMYDNLMTQLLFLVCRLQRRLSLSQCKFFFFSSSLKPIVNGFRRPRSLSTSSACLMSGSVLTYLLPSEFVPTDTKRFKKPSRCDSRTEYLPDTVLHPMLDASPPQQSRLRELRLSNLLLHCGTGRVLPHQPCGQLVQVWLANLPASLHLLREICTSTAEACVTVLRQLVFLRKLDACFTIHGRHELSSACVEDSHFKLFPFCALNIVADKKSQQPLEDLPRRHRAEKLVWEQSLLRLRPQLLAHSPLAYLGLPCVCHNPPDGYNCYASALLCSADLLVKSDLFYPTNLFHLSCVHQFSW